jgi:hypothetical protein
VQKLKIFIDKNIIYYKNVTLLLMNDSHALKEKIYGKNRLKLFNILKSPL